MSPKAAAKKASKKPEPQKAPKASEKESKKATAKVPAKEAQATKPAKAARPAKGGKEEEETLAQPTDQPAEMTDAEREELEEQAEAAAHAGKNSNAEALAAAAGPTEMSASFKNFRHHPDMENFYRFIYENDLRHEALAIIDEIMRDKQEKKKLGKSARS